MAGQRGGDHIGQARLLHLHRRQIDRNLHMRRPARRPGQRLIDHPGADRHDQAGFLGHRHEIQRRDHAQFRVMPTQQCFEPGNAFVLAVHNRLEQQAQLITIQRGGQIGFQLAALGHGLGHFRGKAAGRAAALFLHPVQRQISAAQQIFRRFGIIRRQRPAHRCTHHRGTSAAFLAQRKRPGHVLHDPLRQFFGAIAAAIGQHDGEFIAAQPRDGGAALHLRLHQRRQALCHLPQQQIAGGMAKAIIHRLEAIQIDKQQRRRLARQDSVLHQLIQRFAEQAAVSEARERIEARQLRDAFLAAPHFGHIAANTAKSGKIARRILFRRA